MKRPLIECALISWAAMLCVDRIGIYAMRVIYVSSLAMFAALLFMVRKRERLKLSLPKPIWIGLASLVIVGAMSSEMYAISLLQAKKLSEYSGKCIPTGVVTKIDARSTILKGVQIEKVDGTKLSLDRLLLRHNWDEVPLWSEGEIIHVIGSLKSFETERNPGTFSPFKYYNSIGIPMYMEKSDVRVDNESSSKYYYALGQIRQKIDRALDDSFENEDAALLKGILIGDDSEIEDETIRAFRASGIAHIMAVSGLHFGILYMLVNGVLVRLSMPYKAVTAVTMCIMLVFVAVTGASFSAVRAFTMVLLHQLSILLRRRYDLWNGLGFVSWASMLINPFVIWNVGFQLSFWAVFAIGLYGKLKAASAEFKYSACFEKWEIVLFPLTVQLVLTPIMMFQFNRVHMYSMFFNIPVALLMPPVFLVGLLSIPAASLPYLGVGLTVICESLLETLRALSYLVLRLPLHDLAAGSPKDISIFLIYMFIAATGLSATIRSGLKKILKDYGVALISSCISLCLFLSFAPSKDKIRIDFLDVGQGDAALIEGEKGGHILIDAGPENADLADILLKQGITSLDAVFLSHPDSDHYYGFIEIAKNIKVKTFYHGLIHDKSQVLEDLKELYPKTDFIQFNEGDRILWEGIDILTLHPNGDRNMTDYTEEELSSNNQSLTLLLNYKGRKLLFTGDMESVVENRLVTRYGVSPELINVDILKVAHHGSRTSSTEAFVSLVDPEIAIIQVGRNFFGHPSKSTLSTLEESGAGVYRNDKQGCIRLVINENIHVKPFLVVQ